MSAEKPNLEELRQTDPTNREGNVEPEFQTLNFLRVRKFFADLVPKNQNETNNGSSEDKPKSSPSDLKFTLDMGINLTSMEKSPSGNRIYSWFKAAKTILKEKNLPELLDIPDKTAFTNALNTAISNEKNNPKILEANKDFLTKAYDYLRFIEQYGKESLRISQEARTEEQKLDYRRDVAKGLKEYASEVLKRWDKVPKGQKYAAGIATAVLTGVLLFADDNPTIKKIKTFVGKVLGTGLKVVGGGIGLALLDFGGELLTGTSVINYLYAGSKPDVKNLHFWEGIYGEKGAEKVAKGLMVEEVRNASMISLLGKYKEAVKSGSKKISDPSIPASKMSEEDLFEAVEAFVNKTISKNNTQMAHMDNIGKTNALIKEYGGWKKNEATYGNVVSAKVCENFEIEGNVLDRIYEAGRDFFARAHSKFEAAPPTLWIQQMYEKYFGSKPTPEALLEFKKRFGHCIDKSTEVESTIEQKIAATTEMADTFKEALRDNNKYDRNYGVHYIEKGGYTYVIAESNIASSLETENSLEKAILNTGEKTGKFISKQYNIDDKKAEAGLTSLGSIYVIENGTFYYFARIKTPTIYGQSLNNSNSSTLSRPPISSTPTSSSAAG